MVERAAYADGCSEMPAGLDEDVEVFPHDQGGGEEAEEDPGPEQHRRADDTLPSKPGRAVHESRLDFDASLEQAGVGRCPVALADQQDVAEHQLGRLDRLAPPIAHNRGLGWQVAAQQLDGPFRLLLLNKGKQRVEHDDRERWPSRQHRYR